MARLRRAHRTCCRPIRCSAKAAGPAVSPVGCSKKNVLPVWTECQQGSRCIEKTHVGKDRHRAKQEGFDVRAPAAQEMGPAPEKSPDGQGRPRAQEHDHGGRAHHPLRAPARKQRRRALPEGFSIEGKKLEEEDGAGEITCPLRLGEGAFVTISPAGGRRDRTSKDRASTTDHTTRKDRDSSNRAYISSRGTPPTGRSA